MHTSPPSSHGGSARTLITALTLLGLIAASLVASQTFARAQSGPDLRINEFSSAGPGGSSDDFIELINLGDAPASLEGWQVYRCAGTGSRVYDPQVPTPADGPSFAGVTLAPGETFVLANGSASADVLAAADVTYGTSLADGGSGVWLADPDEVRVDSVAMYAPSVDSECGIDGGVLGNVLDYGRDQTYQRVATTGDNATDWVPAARTPGAANATAADPGVQPSDVLITELTNGGPGGSSDNFVEISNRGEAAVDIGGWQLSRCTGSGIRTPGTLQAVVPAGTQLEPGASFVFAHPVVGVPADVPHVEYGVSLANAGFGAILADDEAVVRDAVAVYDRVGSPCTQGTAAPNILDYGFDETYQRRTDTGDNAADFHVRTRTLGEDVVPDPADDPVPPTLDGPVRISELSNADASNGAGDSEDFFELANYGDEAVDIGGWAIHRCQADGRRNATPQVTVADDTTLAPGETYLAVRAGGPLVDIGDATYTTSFASNGFGLVAYDAAGTVVDRVAAYGTSGPTNGPEQSPCTNVLHITTHLDTARGMSWQRLDTAGVDAMDFVEAPRTPGELATDLRRPEERTAEELAPVAVDPQARPLAATDLAASAPDEAGEVTLSARAAHTTGATHDVAIRAAQRLGLGDDTRGFAGVSSDAPLDARTGADETAIAAEDLPVDGAEAPALVTDDRDGFPYQRYELAVGEPEQDTVEVTWSGRSVGANEVQLYAWDHDAAGWALLDAAGGRIDEPISLLGRAEVAASVRDGQLDVLVQDGPRTGAPFQGSDAGLETFADPSTYDGAMVHLTDTQFLSQSHRDVFADMIQWIVQFADSRRIDYSIHTGDIIETWLNGTHLEAVARDEFRSASQIMAMLDDAGHPYGILPGNHDDKWGRDKSLYDEFFPAERYEDDPWYGGSFPEGTNRNHYDVVDIGGKELLVVSLGYYEGDDAIEWANDVIADHPELDVVFATHEYLNTEGDHSTTENYRWTSLGREYFERIVVPNDNVIMTLSGHYHGVADVERHVEEHTHDDGTTHGHAHAVDDHPDAHPDGAAQVVRRDGDRVVLEMLADYQNYERDGQRDTGFQRILQFDWDAGAVAVNTYSPTLDEHNADEYDVPDARYRPEDDEFTLPIGVNDRYAKQVETTSIGVQAASDGPPLLSATADDGELIETTRPADRTFGWYVESSDASGTLARTSVKVVAGVTPDPEPEPDPEPDPDPEPVDPVDPPVPSAPTDKDQCRNGGWRDFDDPSFRNQGQCVSFVASGELRGPAANANARATSSNPHANNGRGSSR